MSVQIRPVSVSAVGLTDGFAAPATSSIETMSSLSSTPPSDSAGGASTSSEPSAESTGTSSSASPVTKRRLGRRTSSGKKNGDGRNSSQGTGRAGVKDDGGKLRFELLPWKALSGLVAVLTFGARKYSPNGWRLVPQAKERYTAALLRHLAKIQLGEKIDPETGLRHIDHLLCNAAFLAELED